MSTDLSQSLSIHPSLLHPSRLTLQPSPHHHLPPHSPVSSYAREQEPWRHRMNSSATFEPAGRGGDARGKGSQQAELSHKLRDSSTSSVSSPSPYPPARSMPCLCGAIAESPNRRRGCAGLECAPGSRGSESEAATRHGRGAGGTPSHSEESPPVRLHHGVPSDGVTWYLAIHSGSK